jgi:preprotein translocase subunit SecG
MTDVISQILNVLLLVIAIALIGIVVIQRNEGGLGGLGGSSGGGMGGLMTGRSAANFLTKVTRWLAVGFFGVTLALAWIATHRSAPESLGAPVSQEAPAAPGATTETGGASAPATDGAAGGTTGGTASSTSGGTSDSTPPASGSAPTTNQ